MSASQADSLAEFHKFVGEQLQQADAPLMSPEEALARWRERQETLAAIREGLADIEAGRTRPVEETLHELKARLAAS
jgi:predicted transcriptional regulator